MKIEMTDEQYEAIRAALITAEIALESTIEELKGDRREFLAAFRETQLKGVKSALANSAWSKIEVKY